MLLSRVSIPSCTCTYPNVFSARVASLRCLHSQHGRNMHSMISLAARMRRNICDADECILRCIQGFFQPIAGEPYKHSGTGLPRQVELLHTAFKLADDPAAMAGISRCGRVGCILD